MTAVNTEKAARRARVERRTKESDIVIDLDLDGTGQVDVDTGVPFYDHMLTALGSHASFDLTVRTKGDVEIEGHHTIEDTAIALGQALGQALGDKRASAGSGTPSSRWTRRWPTRRSTCPAGPTVCTAGSRITCSTPRSPEIRCRITPSSTGTCSSRSP